MMNEIERILREFRRIAVVGLSNDPSRPSYGVSSFMLSQGYTIVPVNPHIREWQGLRAYPDLASCPPPIEIVDVFRRSDAAGEVVDEAIRVGAKAVWMQEGVVDEAAAERARHAGLAVVMDRCILKEHKRLIGRTK
jgi:predicted CoA-binding protein